MRKNGLVIISDQGIKSLANDRIFLKSCLAGMESKWNQRGYLEYIPCPDCGLEYRPAEYQNHKCSLNNRRAA